MRRPRRSRGTAPIEFILDPTTGTGSWRARLVLDGSTIQTGVFAEGAAMTAMAVLPAGANTVTFTSLGAIAPANADGSAVLTEVQVTSTSSAAGTRNLNVLVGGGASGLLGQAARTGIKICDPKWPSTDPKGCPA